MRLIIVYLIMFTFAPAADCKKVQISDTDFVISVPRAWKGLTPDCDNMKLHMRVLHKGGKYSDFDVFLKEKGRTSPTRWLRHYQRENLPFIFGRHRIESEEEITAGPYEGTLFHVLDLEEKKNHGLLEALVFTDSHVVFFRYIYRLDSAHEAKPRMERILTSFRNTGEEQQSAFLDYEEGRILCLEEFGLFLKLPKGWRPSPAGRQNREAKVALPSGGSFKVMTFRRVPTGLQGLRELVCKCEPEIELPAKMAPTVFGTTEDEAFCCAGEIDDAEICVDCIIGLHGRGGYALVLESEDAKERELLKKVSAKALLLVGREAKDMKRKALDTFRKAVKSDNIEQIREALAKLVLFSGNDSVATAIGLGLEGSEEIQMECVDTLGRMTAKKATSILQKTTRNQRVSSQTREACKEALNRLACAE